MSDIVLALAEIASRLRTGKVMVCEGQGDPSGGDGCGGQGGNREGVCSCCLGVGLMTPQLQQAIVVARLKCTSDDGSYYPSDLNQFDLLEWITGFYGASIPPGLNDKLYELAGEWRALSKRLDDKTNSLRVEIAAKQGAHNEIRIMEMAVRRAVRALDEEQAIQPESQIHHELKDALP